MGTECYAQVRGSALRVTALDKRGRYDDQAVRYAVSKAVSKVVIDQVVETGSSELLRNDEEKRRLYLVRSDEVIRYTVAIEFLRVDPGLLNLVTNVPLVYGHGPGFGQSSFGIDPFGGEIPDIVGFDADTRLPAASFALEVWSKIAGPRTAGDRRWGYTVFPFLKGGVLSGFRFENGKVSFNLERASTQRNGAWGDGPYPLLGLPGVVSGNTAWRNALTSIAPPAQTNGVVTMADVIEGGTASMTTDDILDGEHVVTSPYVVEGGWA